MPEPVAITVALWLLALAVQLADIGTARFDVRRLSRGTRTGVRLHGVAWTVALAALLGVLVLLGADLAARQLLMLDSPLPGIVTALGAAVLLVAGFLLVLGAISRPGADSYRAIRDELVDLHGVRVHQDVLDELRLRMEAIEEARDSRPGPPEVSLRSSIGWVFRRPQRLLPVIAAVLVLIAAAASGVWYLVPAAVVAIVLSTVLAVAGARASLRLLAAVRSTQDGYRAEALQLLSDAEKTSRKRVAGLGDRVNRALQILREQQD